LDGCKTTQPVKVSIHELLVNNSCIESFTLLVCCFFVLMKGFFLECILSVSFFFSLLSAAYYKSSLSQWLIDSLKCSSQAALYLEACVFLKAKGIPPFSDPPSTSFHLLHYLWFSNVGDICVRAYPFHQPSQATVCLCAKPHISNLSHNPCHWRVGPLSASLPTAPMVLC